MSEETMIDEILLRKIIKSNVGEIVDVEIKDLCDAGDNYIGDLKRTTFTHIVDDKNQSYDIVIKLAKKVNTPGMNMSGMLFSKEINFYMQLVPKIKEWQENKFGSILYHLPFPEAFFGSEEQNIVALDNLKKHGFEMADRRFGLNFEQCCTVLEKIAAFHALSRSYIKDYGEKKFISDSKYLEDIFYELLQKEEVMKTGRDVHNSIMTSIYDVVADAYPEEISDIENLIDYCKKSFVATNIKNYCKPNETFNVVCHGDLWTNNILFKFTESNVTDINFVDFQMCRYCTPAVDLIYFIWLSSNTDVLVNRQDELLELYYKTLIETAEKLTLEISYSLQNLKSDYYGFLDFGISQCLKVILFLSAKKEDALTAEEQGQSSSSSPEESIGKFKKKADNLAKNANDFVKERIISIARYGKKMGLY